MPIEDDEDGVAAPGLTLADAKRHLNVPLNNSLDDQLIQSKLEAATNWVATYTGEEITEETVLPARMKEAILMLTAHLFQNREAVLVGLTAERLPFGLLDMLSDYRAWCA